LHVQVSLKGEKGYERTLIDNFKNRNEMVGIIIVKHLNEESLYYGTGFLFYTSKDRKKGIVLTCAHNVS
jgi:hypothetical protein